jgi:predicted permease
MFKDLKLSLRHLARTPGFTAAAVAVLALGIGLNAIMFSLCHLFAFAGRPFQAPEELVQLYSRKKDVPDSYRGFSYAAWREIAARQDLFSGVLAHQLAIVGVREGGQARRAFAAIVSANYFDVLGVPVRGRSFTPDEDRPGSDTPVVVVSHAAWKRAGSDPGLIGRTLRVNERDFTVVGIAPEGFTGTMAVFGPELFFPLGLFDSLTNDFDGAHARRLARPDAFFLFLVGRLRAGASVESSGPALALAADTLRRAWPGEYEGQELQVAPLPRIGTNTSPSHEEALTTLSIVLVGMTGAVLAIVCLNLASMLLARGQARRRELAIRLALGAGRVRIVRQLLVEGLVLSAAGAGLGLLVGALGTDALLASLTSRVPIALAMDTVSPATLLAAAAAFSVLATLLFALGPALRHSRADVMDDIKLASGQDAPVRRGWLRPRHPLVALQVGLSLALLIAAGLFVRMAAQAAAVDLGLRADDTVLAEVDASLSGYDEARGLDAYARIEERLAALPGVQAAAAGVQVPFGAINLGRSARRTGEAPDAPSFDARWNAVGASYFEAMGVPLQRGRAFSDLEARRPGAPPVAIIDEVLARQLWPDADPLGQSLQLAAESSGTPASPPLEVVGVVGVVRDDFFSKSPGGAVYVPLAQGYRANMHFHVRPRAGADVAALRDAVRREIATAAPGLPLFRVTTFGAHLSGSLQHWGVRLTASLFSTMGGLATLVALVGLYGAISYAVSRRTREIGVRMALGATPSRVRTMVLGEGLRVGGGGVVVGALLGLALGRALDSIFVDVVAFDPPTFSAAALLVLVSCLVATLVPARRATAIDPSVALRAD